MKKYYILYDYGFRKIWIQTKREDYERICISMASEFEVHNEEKEEIVKTMRNKRKIIKWRNHYIYNYHGDKYIFGSVIL